MLSNHVANSNSTYITSILATSYYCRSSLIIDFSYFSDFNVSSKAGLETSAPMISASASFVLVWKFFFSNWRLLKKYISNTARRIAITHIITMTTILEVTAATV